MARNFTIKMLRGILANIPALVLGELYLATDTADLYGGVTAGNVRINTPVYSAAGVKKIAAHIVADQVTLSGGGTATITLLGKAAFTSATSYVVTTTDTSAMHAQKVTQNSGTSFTITGTGNDIINFIAVGE